MKDGCLDKGHIRSDTERRRAQEFDLELVVPWGGILTENARLVDAEELRRQIHRPTPLLRNDPTLRLGILALKRTDEDFVFKQRGRQHDVFHGRVEFVQ